MASGTISKLQFNSSLIASTTTTDTTSYTSPSSIDTKYKMVTLRFYEGGWGLSIPWILSDSGSGSWVMGVDNNRLVVDIVYNATSRKFTITRNTNYSTLAGWDYLYITGLF